MPQRPAPNRPNAEQLKAAYGRTINDVIAPDLRVLFCGINPGLYSGATGHHFARPGNRFWPALHGAGFSPRLLKPEEEQELLPLGYGITNLVARTTATADELQPDELLIGAQQLREKLRHFRPCILAVLGITAYRTAFGLPKATLGRQPELLEDTLVWILPNPSGLNAHYRLDDLVRVFRELYDLAWSA